MKYTEHLVNSFYSSTHTGSITGADMVNKVVNKETGDAVKIFLIVEDGKVKDAKFQACGSVVLFASLSAIMDIIIGNTLDEALKVTEKNVIKEIKQVNRCDYSMVSFAVKALHVTLNNYFKKLERGAINKSDKPSRVRSMNPAKTISVYEEKSKDEPCELETLLSAPTEEKVETEEKETPVREEKPVAKKVAKKKEKPVVVEIIPETKAEVPVKVEPEIEMEDLTPVIITPTEVIESVPTKIEVRVLDDEEIEDAKAKEKLPAVETKPAKAKNNKKAFVADESDKNDDVIDEIDSITAKLTDAITKLNFKFDVDDDE